MSALTLDNIDLQLLAQLQTNTALSNQELAEQVHVSPPTCLRRIKRLKEAGLIEREIAVLSTDKLATEFGHGLTAVVEITLDRQDQAVADHRPLADIELAQTELGYSPKVSIDAGIPRFVAWWREQPR